MRIIATCLIAFLLLTSSTASSEEDDTLTLSLFDSSIRYPSIQNALLSKRIEEVRSEAIETYEATISRFYALLEKLAEFMHAKVSSREAHPIVFRYKRDLEVEQEFEEIVSFNDCGQFFERLFAECSLDGLKDNLREAHKILFRLDLQLTICRRTDFYSSIWQAASNNMDVRSFRNLDNPEYLKKVGPSSISNVTTCYSPLYAHLFSGADLKLRVAHLKSIEILGLTRYWPIKKYRDCFTPLRTRFLCLVLIG